MRPTGPFRRGQAVLLAGAVAAVTVLGSPTGPAVAETPDVAGARTSAELGADRAGAEAAATSLAAQVADLRRRTTEAVARLETLGAKLEHDVPAARNAARTFDAAARGDQAEAVARAGRARLLYKEGGPVALWSRLLESAEVPDLLVRMEATRLVLDADAEDARVRSGALAEAEVEKERLRTEAGSTARLEAEATSAAEEVSALLAEQERLLDEAGAEVRAFLAAEQAARAREEAERAAAAALAAARAREVAARLAATAVSTRDAGGSVGDLAGARFAASPPINGAGLTCPVGTVHSFADTWNAPRSGGRHHQGTDVFAPEGSPAYAIADGVVDKASPTERGLGGITLWLRSDSGDRYYYAHNNRNLVSVGQRVSAGDVVALVGRTGNARSTPPHVHFELHPGGGAAVNPYALLRRVCG